MILIFDECTSGFRETYGGIHGKYGVNPDIAIYGKALGNGYAITAVVGKKIMKNLKNIFISSTFWSERIGYVAALQTLKLMKKKKTWVKISKTGDLIKKGWQEIFYKYGYDVKIQGIKSIPNFSFKNKNNERVTYFTQEMLKKGFLAGNVLFVSISHETKIVKKYLKAFDEVIYKMNKIEKKIDIRKKFLVKLNLEVLED